MKSARLKTHHPYLKVLFSWLGVFSFAGAVSLLSLLPMPRIIRHSASILPSSDKIFHFFIYMAFSCIMLNVAVLSKKKYPYFLTFSYAFGFGLLMEAIQYFLPYRSMEWADVLANFLGVIAGCAFRFFW